MAKLVDRLKSLKSLKHLVVETDSREENHVQQTPTDPSVAHAEASLSPASPCSQGPDVIQTPTCMHVAAAEADIGGGSPGGSRTSSGAAGSGGSFVGKLARRLTHRRSFHSSYDDFDSIRSGAAARAASASVSQQGGTLGRQRSRSMGHTSERRTLQFSRSHPDLLSSAAAATPAITVLGREARRRSERRRGVVSEDGAACPALPRPPPEVATSRLSDAAAPLPARQTPPLYSFVAPLPSPFADGCDSSFTYQRADTSAAPQPAQANGQQPDQAAALSPSKSSTERLTLQRKISSCKLIVSTCPLEQQPGDIMLSPEVVEFCSGALASLGGRYTGEIEFSGRSARVARRLSSSPTGAAAQLPGPAPPEGAALPTPMVAA